MAPGDAGDLVLMGPPGAGKGTQARFLVDRQGWCQLATGDLFRDHLRRKTPLGVLADGFMSKGAYVPDEVTVGIVRESLSEIPLTTRVLLDGFPRTVAQAEELDKVLAEAGRRLERVVLIEAPADELLQRLIGRGRPDDLPDIVRKRLDVYAEQTEPVVSFYEPRGIVRRVNGVGAFEDVATRINGALSR